MVITNSDLKRNKKYWFALIFLIIRAPLVLIKFNINEFSTADYWFTQYKEHGIGIYELHRSYFTAHIYPPFFYYFAYLIYFAGGTYLVMKIIWLAFDTLSYYYFYKIGNEFFKSKLNQSLLNYLFLSCPFIFILTAMRGLGESITLFFILSSFYYFIKERFFFSSILLSLGILYGLFPLIMIFPYSLYLLNFKMKFFKASIIFISVFLALFIIIAYPFFQKFGSEYFGDLILIISRKDYSIGVHKVIIDLNLFTISFFEFEISITLYNIIQFIIISTSYFAFLLKYKINSKKKMIICMSYFLLVAPIITRSFHFRMLYWAIPFLIIFLLFHQNFGFDSISLKRINYFFNIQFLIFTILNIFIFVMFILFSLEEYGFGFSRDLFYLVLLIYCFIWGFFLISLNLIKILILEVFILFYCFYLFFFINLYSFEIFALSFFIIYCILMVIITPYFFKVLKKNEITI